jgi:murein DD-endopeptidase MepM/ murein hydrolase activator NlpD
MRWPVHGQAPRRVRGFGDARPARWLAQGLPAPERHHAGVDIAARAGSTVVAVEAGKFASVQRWTDGTKAGLLWGDSGRTYLYAPLAPNSWQTSGVVVGSRVHEGRALGRLAPYPGGDEMLHFEVYNRPVIANVQWPWGSPKPATLMDPAQVLNAATDQPNAPPPLDDGGELGWLLVGLLAAMAWR